MSEIRRYEVGMSIEALASAWARTEDAPDGSVVVVESEISGRLRGGVPWRVGGDDALMMAMVVRPTINPLQEALLWLVALTATDEALRGLTGQDHDMIWPDTLNQGGGDVRTPVNILSVNVMVQLGPGRIEHAVLAVRTRLDGLEVAKDQLLSALSAQLLGATRLLEADPVALLEAFNDRCSVMGKNATVKLLPRGEARGRIVAVDADGFLVLESPTGMLERVAPASVRSLELVA